MTKKNGKRDQAELEMATMAHCRRLINRLDDRWARVRVGQWLASVVGGPDGSEPTNAPTRQADLWPGQLGVPGRDSE